MLVSCLPDTGCTQSIISENLVNQIGATVDTNANIQLLTANGGAISVKGQTQLYLQHKNNTTVTFAIVATGVSSLLASNQFGHNQSSNIHAV